LNIDDYILQLESGLHKTSIIASYNLAVDRKTNEIVFLSGKIEFRDGSYLDFKEFVEATEFAIEKYKYASNYRKSAETFFRYDNAPDPRAVDLKSFPDHKHRKDDELVESYKVTLFDILEEIERMYLQAL